MLGESAIEIRASQRVQNGLKITPNAIRENLEVSSPRAIDETTPRKAEKSVCFRAKTENRLKDGPVKKANSAPQAIPSVATLRQTAILEIANVTPPQKIKKDILAIDD